MIFTAWKVSKYRVFSGPYFPVFGLNTRKYRPEKTPYLDTFHAVIYNEDASLGTTLYMLGSIIMFLSLKQLLTSRIFNTENLHQLRLLVKHNTLELPIFPSSLELFQNIGEFWKNIIQTIELLFFLKKSQRREILQRLLHKCSHLFICISLNRY